MPELPEVETIVRSLQENLPGKKIISIEELYPGTVRHKLQNQLSDKIDSSSFTGVINSIYRRGKFIIINLDSNFSLLIHLRMTGKLILHTDTGKDLIQEQSYLDNVKHIRAVINFNDGESLLFNDPRTFGKIDIIYTDKCDNNFCKMGCEPLTSNLTVSYLTDKFSKRKISIKKALLNQEIIAGIGNIYANEILYRSRMLPSRNVNSLSRKEISVIIKEIKNVLSEAIECNGTTISDYRRVDDKPGTFQNFLQVYGKKACPKTHPVIREKTDGRSTYYCPTCQK